MKETLTTLGMALLLAFFSFLLGNANERERIVVQASAPVVVHDTVWQTFPPVVIPAAPAQHRRDTVVLPPVVIPTEVEIAYLDTVIGFDTLSVRYIPSPYDWFGVEIFHAPFPAIHDTVYTPNVQIDCPRPNYTLPIVAGIVVGILATTLLQ